MVSFNKTIKNNSENLDYFVDQELEQVDFRSAVVAGLSGSPKAIPPKFFYDKIGSNLFDQICETPEYYVTRSEVEILKRFGNEIANMVGPARNIIEYGCGSSIKIKSLLKALIEPTEYLAIDISREILLQTAETIAIEFPKLKVGALCADFMESFKLPDQFGKNSNANLVFFPGSTIGNLVPKVAGRFLKRVSQLIGDKGGILIGVDLKKDIQILNRAYNDEQGYTAAFNLNLLHRMRSELNATVDVASFHHLAYFNEKLGRIEMHLISEKPQIITLDGLSFEIRKEETIHTENSYKYSLEEFSNLASDNGFSVLKVWRDKHNLFSIQYLEPV